jgi:hypothetical protein
LLLAANAAVVAGASGQTVLVKEGDAGTLTVAQEIALKAITSIDTWSYNLTDTASNLLVASTTVLAGATTKAVSDTGTLYLTYENVVKLQAITTATIETWTYNLTDTVINVGTDLTVDSYATAKLASDDIVLNAKNAGAVTYTYTLSDTIAQLMANSAIVNGAAGTTVVDTATNLLSSASNVQAFLETPGFNVKVLGGVGTLTADQALSLALVTTDHSYSYAISDTAADLVAGKTSVLNKATAVTVNDAANDLTVAGHDKLEGITNINHGFGYTIADTATKVGEASIAGTIQFAGTVKATATAAADIIAGDNVDGALTVVYTAAAQATGMSFTGPSANFGGNADVINNFGGADKIDLSAFVASLNDSVDVQAGGLISDGGYAIVNGYWNPGAETFDLSNSGVDSMVVWDADNGAGVNQVAVVLTGNSSVSDINLSVHTVI